MNRSTVEISNWFWHSRTRHHKSQVTNVTRVVKCFTFLRQNAMIIDIPTCVYINSM